MTAREIISRVNKSPEFKSKVFIADISEELNMDVYNYDDQDRLTSFFIGNWQCTDTTVGYKVYFLDEEPVAISIKPARKSDEEFEWVSKEGLKKVKEYILSFTEESDKHIAYFALDDEMDTTYKIHYNSNLYNYHLGIPLLEGKPVKIIELEKKEEGYGIEKNVKIRQADNSEKWIDVSKLDFPFNLTK